MCAWECVRGSVCESVSVSLSGQAIIYVDTCTNNIQRYPHKYTHVFMDDAYICVRPVPILKEPQIHTFIHITCKHHAYTGNTAVMTDWGGTLPMVLGLFSVVLLSGITFEHFYCPGRTSACAGRFSPPLKEGLPPSHPPWAPTLLPLSLARSLARSLPFPPSHKVVTGAAW